MKAKIKYYPNLIAACEDKNGSYQTIYAESKDDIYRTVAVLEENYVVTHLFIDSGEKKEEEKTT